MSSTGDAASSAFKLGSHLPLPGDDDYGDSDHGDQNYRDSDDDDSDEKQNYHRPLKIQQYCLSQGPDLRLRLPGSGSV